MVAEHKDPITELNNRYLAAGHAIQTGVGYLQSNGSKDGEPKHLRTGITLSKTDQAGLVKLLIDKGIITYEEYLKAIAEAAEDEVDVLETTLSEKYGSNITLH